MVEGHSVHRVAHQHRKRLVGKSFQATSPNGRFTEGAKAIDGKPYIGIEAVGKNLFAFFGTKSGQPVVMHVHFGMSGVWAIFDEAKEEIPQTKDTTRLRLYNEEFGIVTHLSAMTVQHGDENLYHDKRKLLGQDPLREDADVEQLWAKVSNSNKSIGALIMDQSVFCGPGNIYRAEILFKAGVHPEVKGKELSRTQFDAVWHHTVALLQRGFQTGSILTVDPEEAVILGKPTLRRYIYNQSRCPRCRGPIRSWSMESRTCYACPECQPLKHAVGVLAEDIGAPPKLFNSHCAREDLATRLSQGPMKLTVAELKKELAERSLPTKGKKAQLAAQLQAAISAVSGSDSPEYISQQKINRPELFPEDTDSKIFSAQDAAAEKAAAGENRAVEHIAELAPSQAAAARHHLSRGKRKGGRSKQDLDAGAGTQVAGPQDVTKSVTTGIADTYDRPKQYRRARKMQKGCEVRKEASVQPLANWRQRKPKRVLPEASGGGFERDDVLFQRTGGSSWRRISFGFFGGPPGISVAV
ncbi:hypothetical protein CYMTET_50504 [Cymbomonas tetramitiformis]|uniref:DNA-(apurinic or apyrimidinic site) lyase n=1 Tax=Cymbomonas tetramitiformis TaxID=36881 RepID=A0AAE0BP28_9CHLO|nr:hypothetical protein CYMTET_50504 [Cymbomonas tetramitiformis]